MIAALLLVCGLTPAYIFPVTADVPVQADFDPQKAAGLWHPIAMVSKSTELTEYEQKISPMDHKVEAVNGGNLKLTAHFMSEDICKEAVKVLDKTNRPGVFQSDILAIKNSNFSCVVSCADLEIHIMAFDPEKYIILHKKKSHEAMFLSARGSNVEDDIKEKFKELALDQGFPEANIKFFENVEQCTPKAD